MARGEVRSASIAWPTRDDLETLEKARAAEVARALAPVPAGLARPDRAGLGTALGGLDAASIAAVIAGDGREQREREAHGHTQGTYRDPLAASAALHKVVKHEGRRPPRRLRDLAEFGELRGKVGWLALGKAKTSGPGQSARSGLCATADASTRPRTAPEKATYGA